MLRYFRNLVASNASLRLSISQAVRAIRAARIEIALALPCCFSSRATKVCGRRQLAEHQAGRLAEGPPQVGVADLVPLAGRLLAGRSRALGRTSRQYETKCR